jgi:hypothetical protein
MAEQNPDAERLMALLAGRDAALETWAEADWHRLTVLAQRQNVAPLLYSRLKQSGVTVPSPVAERLHLLYLASTTRNLRLFHELGGILRALRAAGLAVIPLKGACLAEAVYGNVALRPMSDVDLLVKPGELARALDALGAFGYVAARAIDIETERHASRHLPPLSKPGGVTVELHWTIVKPGRSVRFGDSDLDAVWSRATPATIAGVPVHMLSPVDLLWHLCLHASVQHHFDEIGLRGFWDIALVIRRYGDVIDWEQFLQRVNRSGSANGVHLALQLSEEWTGVAVPSSVMRSLRPAAPDAAAMAWARHKVWHETAPAVKTNVAGLQSSGRIADKLASLHHTFFPSRVSMAQTYPVPVGSWRLLLYYPVRFQDLWTRQGRTLWRLLRRDKALTSEVRQEAHLREYLGETL